MTNAPVIPPFWSDVTQSDGTILTAPPVPDATTIKPTVANVAALTATRTIDSSGSQLATFTSDTVPTDTQVSALIDQATDETLGQLPAHIDQIWWPAITRVISIRAAALVELGYYREQAIAGASSARLGQYANELQALMALVPVASFLG
jgi:hypothetical protein